MEFSAGSKVVRMRYLLDNLPLNPVWPQDISLVHIDASMSVAVHQLLLTGYEKGGGFIPSFHEWYNNLINDKEFDPALCFIAQDQEGIVGICQCWTSGFIKDLVVHPRKRGYGIAKALLLHCFNVFRQRGNKYVDLKVHEDNPSGAVAVYKKLGMEAIDCSSL